jgi:DNA-binding NarL/FixJ family response regulator
MDQNDVLPVRVALSNDYEIALLGLAQMLARYPRQVQVVDITTQARIPHDADIVLYDTFGRVPDGDPKLAEILSTNSAKVVVFSWEDYPDSVALRAGASGYLHKGLSAGELVAAIVAIHDGGLPLPDADEVAADRDVAGEDALTWPGQVFGLTQRESEMLTFVARGLTNEEVARRSWLSVNTVKTYLKSAYRKIDVSSRSQAVAWCYRHGFVSTDDTGL